MMISILILFIIILNVVIFYLNFNKKPTNNNNNQVEFYEELIAQFKKHIDELKKVKHDFKNHILGILTLMNGKRYDDLSKYLKRIFKDEIILNNNFIVTGNPIIDVILNNKINKAILSNIKIETNVYIPAGLKIDEFEFVIVLGNILDNAIEATCKLQENKRYIEVFITYNERRTLNISVINSYDGEKGFLNNKTSKSDKGNHGIGLKNIKQVMDKNNGFFEIYYDNKIFKIKVMFYGIELSENKKV